MPAALGLFAVPVAGAVASIGPRVVAKAIERGGDISGGKNPPSLKAKQQAEELMQSMRQNAKAIELLKKQGRF